MRYVQLKREEQARLICDHICINGRIFELSVTLDEEFGGKDSLQGGRILFLLISEEGVAAGYFHDGSWEIPVPEWDHELNLALGYFVEKYNKMRNMDEKGE